MPDFSSRRRPDKKAAKNQANNAGKPPDNAAKQHALLQLQRTVGNKAVMQMLMQQKNDTAGVKPQAMGLGMVENFPLTSQPVIFQGWTTIYKQVYAYARMISGYKHYVDKMLAGNALMLFHQYKNGFTQGITGLLKNVVIPNVETLIMILRTVASGEPEEGEETVDGAQDQNDDGTNQKKDENEQRIKILEELLRELEKRALGADLDELHKRIPGIDPASLKSPAMLAFQKEVMSGAIFAQGQDKYFESFLKKNDIDIEIFKQAVQTEYRDYEDETASETADRMDRWQDEQQKIKNAS